MQPKLLFTAGVVADSHIPDRASQLHPKALSVLSQAGVQIILHAGDISSPSALRVLEQVAPVEAVRGNRDWMQLSRLPLVKRLELGGVVVALMHGHGGFISYLKDKFTYMKEGYRLERYVPKLLNVVPDAQVVIFGHTHRVENLRIGNQLLLNPGSINFGNRRDVLPSLAILRIYEGGQAEAEIIRLNGYTLVERRWQASTTN